jgi:hypothetical protein
MVIYNKWLQNVKPTIAVNWDAAKRTESLTATFILPTYFHKKTNLKEKLFVLLRHDHYELDRKN